MKTKHVVMNAKRIEQSWAGIPGIEVSPGGRLFLTWFSGGEGEPSPRNTVYLALSDDGGDSFGEPLVMAAPSPAGRAFDPALWIAPTGALWLIYNRGDNETAAHGVFARVLAMPDAGSLAWGGEFRVGYDVPFSFRMNKPIALSTGEWIMPVTHALNRCYAWFAGGEQLQGVGVSHDEGRTWRLHGAVVAPDWALENMIVECRDGSLLMYIRAGGGTIWQSRSHDRGRTWSPGEPTAVANPGSRFCLRALPDGDWLLINSPDPERRAGMTASLSSDEGKTWRGGLMLDERDNVSYPDATRTDDGTVYAVHDRERRGAAEILLSVFTKADVLG